MKVNNYPLKTPNTGDKLFGSDVNGDQKQFDMSAVSNNVFQYEIGEYVEDEGGVIFHRYLDGSTQNYLVVSIANQSSEQAWSNVTFTLIGSTAQSTWDGLSNSNAIAGQSGFTNGAAKTCLDLVLLGKDDWYLPSLDEANLILQNRFNIAKTFKNIVGASVLNDFWTSTEFDAGKAYYFKPSSVIFLSGDKSQSGTVRAIRKFSI
jgi:hypothetical protein